MLQDAANPYAGRDGVASMNTDLLAFEIFGITNAGFRVVHDGAVVKNAGGKNRYRREALSIGFSTDVRRDRHLADVVFQPAHHPAECLNKHRHIDVIDLECSWFDRLIPQGPGMTIRT